MQFEYKALDAIGAKVKDTIDAATQKEAVQKVRDMGYFPTNIKAVDKRKKKNTVTIGAIFEGLTEEVSDNILEELKAEKKRLKAESVTGKDARDELKAVQELIDAYEELDEDGDSWEALGKFGRPIKDWLSGKSKTDHIEVQLKAIVVQLEKMNEHLDSLRKRYQEKQAQDKEYDYNG